MSEPGAIVFLHAFPLNARMWEPQRVAVGDTYRVLAPHLPGFGGRQPDPPDLTVYARRVLEEMDAAGIGSALVVGLSMGGYVALRLFEMAPGRIGGLVLADTRATPDDEEGRRRREEQAGRARREGVGWLAEAMLPALLGETTRRERPEVVEKVRGLIGEASAEGVARALLAMRDRPDSTPLLEQIQVPVLVLTGQEDTLTPPEQAREMTDELPHARFEAIEGAGHLSNVESPLEFNEALLRFAAEVLALHG